MISPGSYKAPLERGLRLLGAHETTEKVHPGFQVIQEGYAAHLINLADGVRNGDIKLVLSSSIQGAVTTRQDLAAVFIEALDKTKHEQDSGSVYWDTQEICAYYIQGLREDRMVPAEREGAYVYPYGDSHAKYVGS